MVLANILYAKALQNHILYEIVSTKTEVNQFLCVTNFRKGSLVSSFNHSISYKKNSVLVEKKEADVGI
jgi:hypothetical protein